MATIEQLRGPEHDGLSISRIDLAALNRMGVSVAQLIAARQVLGELAEALRWDPAARREALRAAMAVPGAMVDAIDWRLLATRKWEDVHDPDRVLSQMHLMEAATLAPLVETDHGIGFRDTTFRELVDFIAELPG